ncbi:MAG: helix-turn-helix domain-containing protein [Oscillospiraceae bacterium]|nr:helix-turn-helix domain-containing protein [Oscillospiraceae bacterium]
MITVGETLSRLRREKKLLQKDVAAKLAAHGIIISAKTVYNWEKGLAQPNANQFLALCEILGVDDVLWQFSGVRRGPLSGLNRDGREKAREFINLLSLIDAFREEPGEEQEPPRLFRLYDIPVSAGTGNFLGDSGYNMISAPAHIPDTADYALRVSGDSMEPLMSDGQIIWVKEQDVLESGEVGIFVYDGDVYCKELSVKEGRAYLKSRNPKYGEIKIADGFPFKALGKVVY